MGCKSIHGQDVLFVKVTTHYIPRVIKKMNHKKGFILLIKFFLFTKKSNFVRGLNKFEFPHIVLVLNLNNMMINQKKINTKSNLHQVNNFLMRPPYI